MFARRLAQLAVPASEDDPFALGKDQSGCEMEGVVRSQGMVEGGLRRRLNHSVGHRMNVERCPKGI